MIWTVLLLSWAAPLQEAPAAAEPERLEAWPAYGKGQRDAVLADIERLRKARVPEMGEQARAALSAAGAVIVPDLLPVLGVEKDEAALKRVEEVLLAVTDARHTRLLAKEFDHKSPAVRTFALRRAAAFPDPGIRAAAEKAWGRARELDRQKKGDPAELLAAALAATSSGSLAGLDLLIERARDDWGKLGRDMRAATEGARGAEATQRLAAHLTAADRKEQIAALNLLSGCGSKEEAPKLIKPFLDSEDNGLRIAAINSLRGIVDGEGPIEKRSEERRVGKA